MRLVVVPGNRSWFFPCFSFWVLAIPPRCGVVLVVVLGS